MKTPSTYPVLDNRPIDQWKVTELKEELRRRMLPTKGLKDDLVRRLDDALRNELESVGEVDVNNDFQSTPEPEVHADYARSLADTPKHAAHADDIGVRSGTTEPIAPTEDVGVLDGTPQSVVCVDGAGETFVSEKTEIMMTHGNNEEIKGTSGCDSGINEESVVLVTSLDTNILVNEVLPGNWKVQDGESTGGTDLVKTEETPVHIASLETSITVDESAHGVAMDVRESLKDEFLSVGDNLKTQFENQESESTQDVVLGSSDPRNQFSEVSTGVAFQLTQLEAEVAKPPQDGIKLKSSNPSNQVSEVNTVLGFQVKSESISSDSVLINRKNELKDNIIADNVKLEKDVKPEMVHPSSSNVISDGSEPPPMDVEEPCGKQPVEEGDERNANLEMSKKNDILDVGSSEKLNLDRSPGDDSMDDDTLENKPIDSKYDSGGVVDQGEKIEGSIIAEASVMSDDILADKKDLVDEMEVVPAAPIVKRKLNDEEVVGNSENSKRQRRWNTGTLKVPEPQSNMASFTTAKDMLPTTTLKRNFSRSDSTASEEAPKERVVPPSPKSPTTSLRIDQFLRPFTLKAVQELLGKTGSVTSFWMDHIKTHCYVTYSSVEEAVETRNAVYNLQWPPNGGRLLLAEFVDPQEVKMRLEASPSPATPVSRPTMPPAPPITGQPLRQQVQRQQLLPPPPSIPLPPPRPLSNPPQARERLPSPPMEKVEKIDTPIVTLDDLFRKTKATPRIYYLPLNDEQVTEKQRNNKK